MANYIEGGALYEDEYLLHERVVITTTPSFPNRRVEK